MHKIVERVHSFNEIQYKPLAAFLGDLGTFSFLEGFLGSDSESEDEDEEDEEDVDEDDEDFDEAVFLPLPLTFLDDLLLEFELALLDAA